MSYSQGIIAPFFMAHEKSQLSAKLPPYYPFGLLLKMTLWFLFIVSIRENFLRPISFSFF